MKKRVRKTPGKIRMLKAKFKRKHGYSLDLENPRTLSEKIQWIKLNGNIKRFSKYVDKFRVRNYVKEKIGEQYLIPLFGVYDNVNQIEWGKLPNSFAMKTTHGATWNLIVKDKTRINRVSAKRKLRRWLRLRYYTITGESNYRNIKPRIVIEKFIKDPTGDLKDYKFFCFHGEPKFIQVDGGRFSNHKRDFYDLDWNNIPVRLKYKHFQEPVTKPSRLNEMLTIARKLSADFAFVRVDLYYTNEQIYFGEITFTPANGFKPFRPRYYDELFGQFLDISKYI
ncbi:ATP-grasp fold amidoligase family protein [Neobacillus kokaensis]|uniref:Glycosyl transferase n=1 Tax=Neobacillus kokaensis TaxID=2759023 RepID=A0ABQ3NAK2_9BACI|nr:ATP-grasp fold amidoligase family protein [Neobacillus kokaensis]GHH99566.1 glycosyl transferase [Neobacillus kokaensis]